jgi:hypothetical protein
MASRGSVRPRPAGQPRSRIQLDIEHIQLLMNNSCLGPKQLRFREAISAASTHESSRFWRVLTDAAATDRLEVRHRSATGDGDGDADLCVQSWAHHKKGGTREEDTNENSWTGGTAD